MKTLTGGCRVYSAADGPCSTFGNWTARAVISQTTGAQRITQTVSDYGAGLSPSVVNPGAEEVLYVAAGQGTCRINGFDYPLGPGAAIFVPPGAVYSIENTGTGTIRMISSCCPEDPQRHIVEASLPPASGQPPRLLAHEDLREDIRAGQDRLFRYLVYTDLGCRQITQFAGWIPPGKAPVHYHTYEECIFILEGGGIVHTDDESCEFGPGSSIYFPIGVRHCVENPGDCTVKLLGAFYPSGSPGEAYEPGQARDP
ncbi:MAG TPA: cupin domain-containing protein [Bryobacteraceae bacterium]|nr:cupin domain-containing protein [Bryobacteraceae bacterium]